MVNYAKWLGELGDNTPVGSLSIPGTHNSAACHIALPSVQCQGASVTDQLEHGVRFLDVRVGKHPLKSGNEAHELIVVHGKFPVRIPIPKKFADTLEEVYEFLDKHQSETVMVSIKQEGMGDWNHEQDEFANVIWEKFIEPNKNRWFLSTELPRLGDARGKAMLFRRFGVKNEERKRQYGFDAAWWKYNSIEDDRGSFVVQDFCEIQTKDDIPKKVTYVKSLAHKAAEHNATNSDNKLYVNFTLGSNFFNYSCWPKQVAHAMASHDLQDSFAKGSGIIVLDFVDDKDWGLIRGLIDKNF
ncbi:PLC-like phosphodiesterase [Metschnikowia bicuspidata var. bicuspidata NRRL YB-4993]|uniref:PLC-like phosphodiesterase n=1 Tax=Metschnikowia bicuspidata var. bicuspidata NRRL YB-4993 TaxID=869754 RepID=A0A1A0HDS5_9ASCO|nr:PLC-like phosphodiesterase [Metschnikowia bicuspidata var. bicuspidata NRRL YB-4993]OBA22130.1 PLC-like phosphodiesterase [Metschnikowia bicuspidata var. bicuspidata NRRL YB-4993]